MKREMQDKLFKEFPLLYGDRNKSMQETCMCWGVDCGSGWYGIIYDLSAKLEKEIQQFIDENPDLPCACCWQKESEHKEAECHGVKYEASYLRAVQVKEKFGTLRFYLTSGTDKMYDLIDEAEELSGKTCESCGKPGETGGTGWISTLCGDCRESRK